MSGFNNLFKATYCHAKSIRRTGSDFLLKRQSNKLSLCLCVLQRLWLLQSREPRLLFTQKGNCKNQKNVRKNISLCLHLGGAESDNSRLWNDHVVKRAFYGFVSVTLVCS